MGFKLKEARNKRNMSQQELSDKSGVSRVTIALIESGKTQDVLASTILKLANALDMSAGDVFFADDVKST